MNPLDTLAQSLYQSQRVGFVEMIKSAVPGELTHRIAGHSICQHDYEAVITGRDAITCPVLRNEKVLRNLFKSRTLLVERVYEEMLGRAGFSSLAESCLFAWRCFTWKPCNMASIDSGGISLERYQV